MKICCVRISFKQLIVSCNHVIFISVTLIYPVCILLLFDDLSKWQKLGFKKAYLFSARTFFPQWEQVYMLSPSKVSLMVTSSRDSCLHI